ncbi:hypothetical protein [Rhodococcus sp. UFZ-B548]|uniref:hypothetical protein n=1 Tax=Rhodococcus sp. UFZ-B548 TaxID=2742212 RepID=UPI0015F3FE2E|nr:hypothetical protein [Rhodococcus sp. UFZ-B548]
MSVFGGSPQAGDWVVATAPITRGFLAGEVRAGSPGVVAGSVRGIWSQRVPVRFDCGLAGLAEVDAPVSSLRITRRGAGQDRFVLRTQWFGAVRAGVALALLAPIVYFATLYIWTYRSVDGLLMALVIAALDSAVATVSAAISHPVPTAVFLVASWGLARFAFR